MQKKSQLLILWLIYTGENFFNPKTKKWAKVKAEDNKRSFNMYVLDPIYKMFDAIMNFKKEETDKLLDRLELKGKMKHEELAMEGNPLLNKVQIFWEGHKNENLSFHFGLECEDWF